MPAPGGALQPRFFAARIAASYAVMPEPSDVHASASKPPARQSSFTQPPSLPGYQPDTAAARAETTALFAQGVGLLLLRHTGRIKLFGQDADALFAHYVDALIARRAGPVPAPAQPPSSPG